MNQYSLSLSLSHSHLTLKAEDADVPSFSGEECLSGGRTRVDGTIGIRPPECLLRIGAQRGYSFRPEGGGWEERRHERQRQWRSRDDGHLHRGHGQADRDQVLSPPGAAGRRRRERERREPIP